MSYFNNLTLTTKGQEMLLSSNMNIDKIITFTNASLGSEKLLPDEIKGATEIKNSWLKFPLNTVRIINDESNYFLRTEIAFTNIGITKSKIMRELGIYAKFENEEEVLFAYSTTDDDGETIPKEDIVPATYKFTIDTTISTETKINQTLSPEGFLTKEVVELLKYYIANIAVQRFKGILTAGQTIININSEGSLLTTLSKRLQLFIGGELYTEGTDYTVNIENNTIQLNDEFRFQEGTVFEVIDNLPPGYVKELLDEFFKKANEKELEILKKLETVQTENVESIKTLSKQISDFLDNKNVTITGKLDKKIKEFYLNLDTYIEKNKEKLKGKSLYQSWLDIGNIGSESDFVNAMKIKGDDGDPGRGIVSTSIRKGENRQRIITILYTDDTTEELIVEDGQSAYEVWKNIGNDGTEIDFFKSLQGAGLEYSWRGTELGVRVAGEIDYTFVDLKGDVGKQGPTGGDGPRGKSAYIVWLDLGNEGTEEEFFKSIAGADFKTLQFVRFDTEGNTVVRSLNSKDEQGEEITINRGEKGEIELAYGIVVEHPVTAPLPKGWVYTNGTTISKVKYPHMADMLPTVTAPQVPYFTLDDTTKVLYDVMAGNLRGTKYEYSHIKNEYVTFYGEPDYQNEPNYFIEPANLIRWAGGNYPSESMRNRYVGLNRSNYKIYLPSTDEMFLSFIEIDIENMKGNNANPNQLYGDDFGTQNVDWYLKVEAYDSNETEASKRWKIVGELHNKTDFFPVGGESQRAFHMFSNGVKTREYRFSIMEKSTPNILNNNNRPLYFIGKLRFGFDKNACQLDELMVLPNLIDSLGNYKIMYVGNPLEASSFSMYSYAKDNTYNGEVPFSLAANNELPNYSEGITMAEPKEFRIGYINRYNNKSDSWELVRTHENQQGYYYNDLGDLKYIIKPTNYHIWDFKANTWIEDTLLKENAKKELLDKYIELEIKKDKMLDLKLNTAFIVEEIEKIKKELEELNE